MIEGGISEKHNQRINR